MGDEKDSMELVTAVAAEWAKLSYDDLLQPYASALGDVGRIVTLPVAWLRHKLEPTLERVRRKVPQEKLVEPPKVVATPLLQALPAAEDEPDLSAMYEELLAKSMHADHRGDVHPAYAGLVGQLSPDEARLLHGFRYGDHFVDPPLLGLIAHEKSDEPDLGLPRAEFERRWKALSEPKPILGEFRGVGTWKHPELVRPRDVDLYLRNLERLGLVRQQFERSSTVDDWYETLDRFAGAWMARHEGLYIERAIGTVEITSFGRGFMSAVLPEPGPAELGKLYKLRLRFRPEQREDGTEPNATDAAGENPDASPASPTPEPGTS